MIELFPDQMESVQQVADKMHAKYKNVLLQSATGSGKSVMASYIIQRTIAKGNTCWFVVPRKDLLFQMSDTFRDFNIEHSFIASGMDFIPNPKAHIASLETLRRRLDKLKPPRLAVIDETHFGSTGLDYLIKWLKKRGSYIIGLTATPWKMSGQGLGCWYDEMVLGKPISWLIENKRLADYRPFWPDHIDLSQIKMLGNDYNQGHLSSAMEDRVLIGNAVKHYKDHAMGLRGVTFAVGRKHSELLAQTYRDNGVPAMHVDGETPMDERRRIFKALAKKELLQVCNAELLVFGFDIARAAGVKNITIECGTDCQPTKSVAKQRQKWGRFLRYDGNIHPIFDHANNFAEHGFPKEPVEWTLEDRPKAQKEKTEPTQRVFQCPKCHFCHRPAPYCSNCGYVYPVKDRMIEEIEGVLVEVNEEAVLKKKKEARSEVGRARTLADLERIADERNYKRGWVRKMAQLKGINA